MTRNLASLVRKHETLNIQIRLERQVEDFSWHSENVRMLDCMVKHRNWGKTSQLVVFKLYKQFVMFGGELMEPQHA